MPRFVNARRHDDRNEGLAMRVRLRRPERLATDLHRDSCAPARPHLGDAVAAKRDGGPGDLVFSDGSHDRDLWKKLARWNVFGDPGLGALTSEVVDLADVRRERRLRRGSDRQRGARGIVSEHHAGGRRVESKGRGNRDSKGEQQQHLDAPRPLALERRARASL